MSLTIQTIYGTLDEKQLKELKNAIQEVNNYYSEIDHRNNLVKEIISLTADNTKIPKKIIAKMAKVYYKQSFQQEVAQHKEFESLFEGITEIK